MARVLKIILSLLCFVVMISGVTVSAVEKELPAGFLIDDENGISVTPAGEFFLSETVAAGDVLKKSLTIRNKGTRKETYTLTIQAEAPQSNGPIELTDRVQLELEYEGKILYSGRLRGDDGTDMLANALEIDTFAYGDTGVLNITLRVEDSLKLYWTKSETDFRWQFTATTAEPTSSNSDSSEQDTNSRDTNDNNDDDSKVDDGTEVGGSDTGKGNLKPAIPITGAQFSVLLSIVLLLTVSVVLMLLAKRRNEQRKED